MTEVVKRCARDVSLGLLKRYPGFHFVRLKPGRKVPESTSTNYYNDPAKGSPGSTNDPKVIAKWPANCNVGLVPKLSGVVVVDEDRKPGKVGAETIAALEAKHGPFPETLKVRTPSGGFHRYYVEANGVKYRFALGESGFGKDVDSPPYVLIPGSKLPEGVYTTVTARRLAPSPAWFGFYLRETNMADADQTPVVDLDTDEQIEWAIHFLTHDAKSSIVGQNGEFALLMTAVVLKDHGISEDKAIDLLCEHYNVPKAPDGKPQHPYCDPLWGLNDGPVADRLDVKVHNAWLYLRQNAPGAMTPEAIFGDDDEGTDFAADMARRIAWWKQFDARPEQVERRRRRAAWERARRLVTIPDSDRQV